MEHLNGTTHRLDTTALWNSLDHVRRSRGLSWRDVSRQTGVVSSTFSRMRREDERGMHSSALVSLLVWLGDGVDLLDLLVLNAPEPDRSWVVSENTVGALCRLIEQSKPHWGPTPVGLQAVDGLTVWPRASSTGKQVVALFGDTVVLHASGRCSVVPAESGGEEMS